MNASQQNSGVKRASRTASRALGGIVAVAGLGLLMSTASPANAGTVTFDWVQQPGGTGIATGSLTLNSSLLTPTNATGQTQFDLTLGQITGAGETVLGELTAFMFSFAGHTLTLSDFQANSTGWRDDFPGEPRNVLESTWSASHVFTTPFPGGTLLDVGNSTQDSFASFGSETVTGEWQLRPVPLPAAAWLLVSGVGGLAALARRSRKLSASLS
jgi:hypothetical protein